MKFLGVDYGRSKIGLAVSEGELASPLEVIKISSLQNGVDVVVNKVVELGVGTVVIGLPESGQARGDVEKFSQKLSREVGAVVVHHPETLSTQLARQEMVELGVSKKNRRAEDAHSAAIILQDYLEVTSNK